MMTFRTSSTRGYRGVKWYRNECTLIYKSVRVHWFARKLINKRAKNQSINRRFAIFNFDLLSKSFEEEPWNRSNFEFFSIVRQRQWRVNSATELAVYCWLPFCLWPNLSPSRVRRVPLTTVCARAVTSRVRIQWLLAPVSEDGTKFQRSERPTMSTIRWPSTVRVHRFKPSRTIRSLVSEWKVSFLPGSE